MKVVKFPHVLLSLTVTVISNRMSPGMNQLFIYGTAIVGLQVITRARIRGGGVFRQFGDNVRHIIATPVAYHTKTKQLGCE